MATSPPPPRVSQESPATISKIASGAFRNQHNIAAIVLSVLALFVVWQLYMIDSAIHNGILLADSVSAQAAAIGIALAVAGAIFGVWSYLKPRSLSDEPPAGSVPEGVVDEADDSLLGTPSESPTSAEEFKTS